MFLSFRGETKFDEIFSLVMMTEIVLETSDQYRQLTRLIAREDFIEYNRMSVWRICLYLLTYIDGLLKGLSVGMAVLIVHTLLSK
jgi:hypothetical protein